MNNEKEVGIKRGDGGESEAGEMEVMMFAQIGNENKRTLCTCSCPRSVSGWRVVYYRVHWHSWQY